MYTYQDQEVHVRVYKYTHFSILTTTIDNNNAGHLTVNRDEMSIKHNIDPSISLQKAQAQAVCKELKVSYKLLPYSTSRITLPSRMISWGQRYDGSFVIRKYDSTFYVGMGRFKMASSCA